MIKFYALCLLWYTSSAVTNNIGKQILNEYKHPVTLTYVQFGMVSVFCVLASHAGIGFGKLRRPSIDIIQTTFPLALFQIVGHILSSVAITYVSVSFSHTIKALSPLFTVFVYRFAYQIIYSPRVYASLIPLTLGVMLVCATQIKFHLLGFVCSLTATLVFVVQNVVSKKLFNNSAAKGPSTTTKLDKLNMLFYSSSMAFILMFPVWIYSDGFAMSTGEDPVRPSLRLCMLFLLNGVSNFSQCLVAFNILSIVSPITYSIASLVKRIFVITASIIYFRDTVSIVQALGISLTFFGLWLYNVAKREVAKAEAHISAIQKPAARTCTPYTFPL
ncbi:triose-phosphate transporter family-domain-containing protein [Entophlyctis helioformis]|nr:triose-phosphate transporter family-domain-containing protein [Entophlyctis helioformis]